MDENAETSIKGVAVAVFGEEFMGWRAGKFQTEDGDTVSFAGTCEVSSGESYTLHGRWVDHRVYGRQFKVAWSLREFAFDGDSLKKLLERDEKFRDIGPARAFALVSAVESMGGDLGAILGDPEKCRALRKRSKVPRKVVKLLQEEWQTHRDENEAKLKLLSLDVPPKVVERLWKLYQTEAYGLVSSDPWSACQAVDGFSFSLADEIGLKKLKLEPTHPARLAAGLVERLSETEKDGHTWTSKSKLVSLTMSKLELGRVGDRKAVDDKLTELLDSGDERFGHYNLAHVGEVVCLPHLARLELGLIDELNARAAAVNPHFVGSDLLTKQGWELELPGVDPKTGLKKIPNEAQCLALGEAIRNKLLVITGPAGTGKTFTIALIAKLYLEHDLRVAVMAPTGKAAKRLFEVTNQAGTLKKPITKGPGTIHKVLGCKGADWDHDWFNPLPADVVIIDETSMLDVDLASRIFAALDTDSCIVFVGDPNQLPSVGPGAFLRDTIEARRATVVPLDQIMRHAGVLRANAQWILKGVMKPTTQEKLDDGSTATPWTVEDRHVDAAKARASIVAHFSHYLASGNRDALMETQVITPQYEGQVGVKALNRELQKVAQKILHGVTVPASDEKAKPLFLVGDKIIQTKNDYTIGLMNGDQAIIANENKDEFILEVGRAYVPVPKSAFDSFMLSYAITVHRFQGSQAETVIAAVHSEHRMNSKKLVYTAATRATKRVFLIGDRGGLHGSIVKPDASNRRTFMASEDILKRFAKEG